MGVATTRDPNSLAPPNTTKKLDPWMDLLGQPLSRNHVFRNLQAWTPLKGSGGPQGFDYLYAEEKELHAKVVPAPVFTARMWNFQLILLKILTSNK